jgi:hypothetical protein
MNTSDPLYKMYQLACLDAQRDPMLLTPERRNMAFLTLAPAAVLFSEWKANFEAPTMQAAPEQQNEIESAYASQFLIAMSAVKANGGKVDIRHAPKKEVQWQTA